MLKCVKMPWGVVSKKKDLEKQKVRYNPTEALWSERDKINSTTNIINVYVQGFSHTDDVY